MAILYAAGVLSLVAWLVVVIVIKVESRAGHIEHGPQTLDLGQEPPALANLLVNGWQVSHDAIAGTLIDLAARRVVTFEQTGPDVHDTVIHIPRGHPPGLRPYELHVLDQLMMVARNGTVPAAALMRTDPAQVKDWWPKFENQVAADARRLGLSRRRYSDKMRALLVLISLVPAVVTWVICFRVGGIGGVVPGFTVWGVLTGVALGNERERDTPRGRAAASHWLGYRDYLVADKQFRTLPPAAVTIWDRHLAYAAAFGFARTAIEALPLATYNEHQAWTTFSGEWTQVRIVYCPARSWWGHSPRRLIWFMARRGLAGGVGLYLLFKGRSTGYDIDSFVDAPPNPILNDWAYRIGFGIAGIVLLLAVRCLVLAVTELRTREEYEGEVVRVREDPKYHYFFVAIADGKSPKVKAYRLFGWAETPEEGARVRIRAGRVLGYVTEIEEFVSARPGAPSRRR